MQPPLNMRSLQRGLALLTGLGLVWNIKAAPDTGPRQVNLPDSPTVTIEDLVTEALQRNPELAFYRAEVAAAQAGRQTAGAPAYPEFSTRVGYKGVRTLQDEVLGEGLTWEVAVLQPLDWPGRLALRRAIANRELELAELGLNQFQAALTAKIRSLGYRLYIAQAQTAARREVANRLMALQEVLLQRDSAGLTPLLETRIIEANTLTMERQAREAAQILQTALLELNRLRGHPPTSPLQVAAAELQFEPASPLDVLLEAARTNNFELRIKQTELARQGFQVSLARQDRRPSLTVGPYVFQEKAADRETQVGLSLSLPLPFWKRPDNNVSLARARQDQAEAALQATLRQVEQDVATQALAYEACLEEMQRWPADALNRFREAAQLADRHYRLGAVPVSTYVELQKQYVEALDALFNTRGEALEAAQQLQLLGGLPQASVKIRAPAPAPAPPEPGQP